MGLNGSSTAEVHFEDCRVPRNVSSEEGKGFKIAMTTSTMVIGIAAQAVGISQGRLHMPWSTPDSDRPLANQLSSSRAYSSS